MYSSEMYTTSVGALPRDIAQAHVNRHVDVKDPRIK